MKISKWFIPSLVAAAVLCLAAVASAGVTTVKSPNRTLDPFGRATVSCPKGSHTLGGGFRTDPGVLAQIDRPKGGRVWQAEGFINPTDQISMKVFARCEPNGAGAVRRVSRSKAVPNGSHSVVDVSCPTGRQVLAGGYAVSPVFTDAPNNSGEIAVDTSMRVGSDTWRVAGVNEGASSTRLVSYAICGKSGARGQVKTASGSAAIVSATAVATAKCQRGWHTLGGGFSTPGVLQMVFPNISVAAPVGGRGWKLRLDVEPIMVMRGAGRRGSALQIRSYAYCVKNGG